MFCKLLISSKTGLLAVQMAAVIPLKASIMAVMFWSTLLNLLLLSKLKTKTPIFFIIFLKDFKIMKKIVRI